MKKMNLLRNNNFEIFLIFKEERSNILQHFKDNSIGGRDRNKINKTMK